MKGAETALTSCSSDAAQEWSYEADGVLRDVADPGLCLDSHLGYSVQLASCTGESGSTGKNVRYDFTLQGELVPRGNQDLALTPAATNGAGALVLKLRKDQAVQHWTLDTSSPSLQMAAVDWDADGAAASPSPGNPPGPRGRVRRTVRPRPRPSPRPDRRRPRRIPPRRVPRPPAPRTTARRGTASTAPRDPATAAPGATAVTETAVTAATDPAVAGAATAEA
ncbi:ricin-type beta-trefoil lectin domain protein [Streptomyces kaempferi]